MGKKKPAKFSRTENKGKDKRHKMKGKSLEAFTEEMHTAFEGNGMSNVILTTRKVYVEEVGQVSLNVLIS